MNCAIVFAIIFAAFLTYVLWKSGHLSSCPGRLQGRSISPTPEGLVTTSDIRSFIRQKLAEYDADIASRKEHWAIDRDHAPRPPAAGSIHREFSGKNFLLQGKVTNVIQKDWLTITVIFADADWTITPARVHFPACWKPAFRGVGRGDRVAIVGRLRRFESYDITYELKKRHLVKDDEAGYQWQNIIRQQTQDIFEFSGKDAFLIV